MSKLRGKRAGSKSDHPAATTEAGKASPPRETIELTVNGVRVEVSPELEAAVHRAYKGLFQPLPKE
jgi:hypothetical protein